MFVHFLHRNCRKNEPAYKALKIANFYNISKQLDIREVSISFPFFLSEALFLLQPPFSCLLLLGRSNCTNN